MIHVPAHVQSACHLLVILLHHGFMEVNDNPEECKVCIVHYDKAKRRPRTLPCGHTFCSLCLSGMIKGGGLACPTCRVHHQATSATKFPISYDMEAVIRKLKILQISSTVPATRDTPDGSGTDLQERQASIKLLTGSLRETMSQLDRYEAQLENWKAEHEEILGRLKELEERNGTALQQLDDERSILLYQRKRGEESLRRLEASQGNLTLASSAQEAVGALEESEASCSEVEDWLQHCRAIFPDPITLHTSLQIREGTRGLLDGVLMDAGEPDITTTTTINTTHPDPMDTTSSIMEKVDKIAPVLSVDSLRRLEGGVEALLATGRVVAVRQDKEGAQPRHARLTVFQGRPHLHTLTPPTPQHPPSSHSLQHEALVSSLNPSSTLVFLELGWQGAGRGRVYVRLAPDTQLARHFLRLCTGEMGPSYLHSRLLGVWNRGTEFEVVGGGDYERDDGQGGALLTGEPRPSREYQRAATAGVREAEKKMESSCPTRWDSQVTMISRSVFECQKKSFIAWMVP
ncbi:hypothetical protein Pmani_004107 [Petrolisthes manimaculis]|uniref:RING-type domain-containing protein n=1 Tax=Petrolisthes manimaculis TaxID=1843537 RepID=A0AAE1UPB1_9EUCA|nr:hypothetical protein Pmani_004107 [Petrolisthes manimaculis]